MRITTLLLVWIYGASLLAQSLYFPPITGDEWATIAPEDISWCSDSIQPLYDFLEAEETKAFIVLKDGRIVMEKYFGTFNKTKQWYWASAGKSLTSFLIGMAQQEGSLSIEDQTNMYLGQGWTSCAPLAENQRTIRNQLTMTTGFNDAFPNFDCLQPSCLNCIAEAGERWAYHNSPYTLLDSVLFYSAGQSASDFFQNHLPSLTGMTGTYQKVGNNHVFFSKARTMARFGLLMLNQGKWNQTTVMTDMDYYHDMIHTSQSFNPSYGYLWWLNGQDAYMLPQSQTIFTGSMMPNAPSDMFMALGKNGQLLNVVPSENLVVVRMGKSANSFLVEHEFNNQIWAYLNAIRCQMVVNKNIEPKMDIRLAPNPARDVIVINAEKGIIHVNILSSYGQVFFAKAYPSINNLEVDVSGFPQGIYLIQVVTDGKMTEKKVLIAK